MTRFHSDRRGFLFSCCRLAVATGLALACLTSFVAPNVANAQTEEQLMEQKNEWQERYRGLLQEAERLKENAATMRSNYSQAQQRNYPRGNARQEFLIKADEAETELVKVKAQLAGIFEEARRAGIPPRWLYEVDDEPIVVPAAADSANADDEEEDDGRNPLYKDDNN
jgi:hypothetical protein